MTNHVIIDTSQSLGKLVNQVEARIS